MEELKSEHEEDRRKYIAEENRRARHRERSNALTDEAPSTVGVGSKRSRGAVGLASPTDSACMTSPSATSFFSESAGSASPGTMSLTGAVDDLVSPSGSSLSHASVAAVAPVAKRRRAGVPLILGAESHGVGVMLGHYHAVAGSGASVAASSSAALPATAGAGARVAAASEAIVIDDEVAGSSADQLLMHLELYERAMIDLCCEKEMTAAMQAKLAAVVKAHPRFMLFVYHRLVMRSVKVGQKLFQSSLRSQQAVLTELHKLLTAHVSDCYIVPYAATACSAGAWGCEHDYAVSTGHFLTQLFSVRMEHELIFGSRREEVAVPLIPAHDDALRTSSSSAIAGFPVPESFGLSTDSGEFFMQYARENHFKGGRRSRK